MISPPKWTKEELEISRQASIAEFRRIRLEEPAEDYGELFDKFLSKAEELLEATVDLSQLESFAISILNNDDLLDTFRYFAGPPISLDDLKTLSEAKQFGPKHFKKDGDLVRRLMETVLMALDKRRFPWVEGGREPTESEKAAAVLASAALIAAAKTQTKRRTDSKVDQELRVENVLLNSGWEKVQPRTINTHADAPGQGQFCRECMFGPRKADLVLGLWDGRTLPIECKVSNSTTNSVKRLTNDVAAKADLWLKTFGNTQVVPSAVLSGAYSMVSLTRAQGSGLTLWWVEDLKQLTDWLDSTKA